MKTINIITTTISGSIKDWRKMKLLEKEFQKHYFGKVSVFEFDSHKGAKEKAHELIEKGETIIVSAGGAGTFNSVLEGARLKFGFPEGLRLAFLRKGSADLIGKVLKIPDDLKEAAKIINNSIKNDKTITSDVIELEIDFQKYHFIGFGGVGIFGIVPFFTENRLKKYYKGLLGYFFGDRGPFLVGANLAVFKHYKDKILRKKEFIVEVDDKKLPAKQYSSIIIVNGDLGKDFPIAKGMPLGNGDFKVILLEDLGILKTYQQIIHIWKGDLEKFKEKLGVQILNAKKLTIAPQKPFEYMVNVDGLLVRTQKTIHYKISDSIKLITG
ncbi:hypothetical protein ES703_49008 [subsurface metagenome]